MLVGVVVGTGDRERGCVEVENARAIAIAQPAPVWPSSDSKWKVNKNAVDLDLLRSTTLLLQTSWFPKFCQKICFFFSTTKTLFSASPEHTCE